jgi:hypothetical protein
MKKISVLITVTLMSSRLILNAQDIAQISENIDSNKLEIINSNSTLLANRILWIHPNGYYQKRDDEKWYEYTKGNLEVSYVLEESSRTSDYVEVSGGNGSYVRLYSNRAMFRQSGQEWRKIFDGHFEF